MSENDWQAQRPGAQRPRLLVVPCRMPSSMSGLVSEEIATIPWEGQ